MAPIQDLKDSQKTYANFTGTLKYVVPIIAVIVLFVIFLIS